MNSLLKMVLKRLGMGILTLTVISMLIFIGVEALPGDPAEVMMGQNAHMRELVESFRKELGLDLPLHIRYFSWINGVFHGDFGHSLATGRSVVELIGARLYNTLFLAVLAAMIAVPISIVLGILAAIYRNTLFDRIISIGTLSMISFPEFFVAYILISLLSVKLGLFPVISSIKEEMTLWQKLYATALPCLTLSICVMAHMMRQTRAAIIGVLSSPFIEMAWLKGLKRLRVIVIHAFPNALSPVINVVAMNLAFLVVGVVIIEVVFVYPGLGQMLVNAVSKRDIPVVQACGLFFASTYIILNLLADVFSIICNPRLRHPR